MLHDTKVYTTDRPGVFENRLEKLFDETKKRQILMEITPVMAHVMLGLNREGNRKISNITVRGYKKEMLADNWTVTNQGVAFDTNRELFDGRHRLTACIEADKPFTTWVAFGLDPANFKHVDVGRKRTSGQIFNMIGVAGGNNIAAVTRLAMLATQERVLMAPFKLGIMSSDSHEPSVDDLLDFYQSNTSISDFDKFQNIYVEISSVPRTTLHAVHWLIAQKHPRLADDFMDKLCSGTGLQRGDSIYKLRKRLATIRARKEVMPKSFIAALIIKCFNGNHGGKPLDVFKIGATEGFPKVR